MNFRFVYNYRHIYQKWVFLVDLKLQKHCYSYRIEIYFILKVFHDNLINNGVKNVDYEWIFGRKNGQIIDHVNRGDSTP